MSSRRRDRSGIEPESAISFAASFALPHADCALPATSLYAPLISDALSSVAEPTNLSPWPTAVRTPPSKLSLFIERLPEMTCHSETHTPGHRSLCQREFPSVAVFPCAVSGVQRGSLVQSSDSNQRSPSVSKVALQRQGTAALR